MKVSIAFTGTMLSLTLFCASACVGATEEFPESAELDPVQETPSSDGAPESVDDGQSALRDVEGDGPGTCKADCVDACTSKGGSFGECTKSCAKACTGASCNGNNWAACAAGSNSSSNQLCLFMNSIWQKTCKQSPALQAFCDPFGGCSGCRKKMDQNC